MVVLLLGEMDFLSFNLLVLQKNLDFFAAAFYRGLICNELVAFYLIGSVSVVIAGFGQCFLLAFILW